MKASPDISVVMGIYNGARYLESGLRSVLEQRGVDLELIVINDGSTDETGRILSEFASADPRVRVYEQENAGLTRALIRGCGLARGRYIARQDGDDLSLPGRLRRQQDVLDSNPKVAFVSSWAEVIGPCDEPLITHVRPALPEQATELLLHGRVGPPGHGSVMFRRDVYERVGGYRSLFYYAQDSDLWLRMGLVGQIAYIQEVLYKYRISAESVSGRLHPSKLPYSKLLGDLHEARLQGKCEAPIIATAKLEPDIKAASTQAGSEAATLYFIARCLLNRRDPRALGYVHQCLRRNPRNLRAWCLLPLAQALMLFRGGPRTT